MQIQYTHPSRGLISYEIEFDCPSCGLHFSQPSASEEQAGPDAAVTVHCTRCGVLVRTWEPPPAPATPIATFTSPIQRKSQAGELIVAAGAVDASTGFASVFGAPLSVAPLAAGDYQLLVSFELSLTANAVWGTSGPDRAAQARVLWNGVEIATWVTPFAQYTLLSGAASATLVDGATPQFDLQLRRFGAAGSARMRRARVELSPIATADISL